MNDKIALHRILKNLGRRHLLAIVLSIALSGLAIGYIGNMLYRSTESELELRGEMDIIQLADRFDSYLMLDKNELGIAKYAVNSLLVRDAGNDEILTYLVEQSERMTNTIDESFTGLYGWISGEYLDGAGWIPDADYVATERPWYITAIEHPRDIVVVDPYIDKQSGNVMMTIASMLDDGESVIALDIGLNGIQEITDSITRDTLGAEIMVLDNGNVAIAHSDPERAGKNYSNDDKTLEGRIVQAIHSKEQDRFMISYGDRTYLVHHKQIEGGWHCVSMIDTESFYKPLRQVIMLTVALGTIAILLILAIFISISRREVSARNMHIQIRAAADIYDNLMDINLLNDTYYELENDDLGDIAVEKDFGRLHKGAQAELNSRADRLVDEGTRLYLHEFLKFDTLNERLANRSDITVEFLNSANKWCRGRFICADRKQDGTVTRVLWGVEIIDDEKRQQEHLRHLAETDLMTGLSNRTTGEYRVREMLESGRGGMFVMFDIDNFKEFNDRYGHDVGDQVIVSVANCLKNAFRGEDTVMRLGGDEFAAYAAGVHTKEIGKRILERFYDNLDNIVIKELPGVKIGVSAGAAFSPDSTELLEELLHTGNQEEALNSSDTVVSTLDFLELYQAADQAMYESKRTADSRITFSE